MLLYSWYALLVFVITFMLLLPFFWVFIQIKKWNKYGLAINRWWARIYFPIIFLPVKVECRLKNDKKAQYVICPNHTSYLDIPITGLFPGNFLFVGKSSIQKVPFFGYMFRKLHIMVNRESLKSRYNTLLKAKEAIDQGKSVLMFPEGGIVSSAPPNLAPFKEGPFRLAIEKQIPVVPVTMPYNWIIMPDNRKLLNWRKAKIIIHEPLNTIGLTLDDIGTLKAKTYDIISEELKKHFSISEGHGRTT